MNGEKEIVGVKLHFSQYSGIYQKYVKDGEGTKGLGKVEYFKDKSIIGNASDEIVLEKDTSNNGDIVYWWRIVNHAKWYIEKDKEKYKESLLLFNMLLQSQICLRFGVYAYTRLDKKFVLDKITLVEKDNKSWNGLIKSFTKRLHNLTNPTTENF